MNGEIQNTKITMGVIFINSFYWLKYKEFIHLSISSTELYFSWGSLHEEWGQNTSH